MTIGEWLEAAQQQLTAAHIDTARLDSLVLLEDRLGRGRAALLAHTEDLVSEDDLATLDEQLQRRSLHEPLAYIRGKSEFYGREFYVDNRVLVPRPESESMIDLLKSLAASDPPGDRPIIDIGTGSGALAISAACELRHTMVMATDIDPACLDIAQKNSEMHRVNVRFFEGDLFEPVAGVQPYALLCNLPYIPDDYKVNSAATHEPKLALYGGADGLELFRRLFTQIYTLPAANRPRLILTESLPLQHNTLADIAMVCGYKLKRNEGFTQIFKLASELN